MTVDYGLYRLSSQFIHSLKLELHRVKYKSTPNTLEIVGAGNVLHKPATDVERGTLSIK